jgi:hypothetical protein
MNNRQKQVGFSQRIRLEWLQQTANLVLAGNDKDAVNASLQELLQDKVSVGGHAVRGNKEKAITILMKIWLNVPRGLEGVRDDGLELLKKLPRNDQIAVHWGMAMAAYPFWAAVAANTGRLLRLQGIAVAAHVQRRVPRAIWRARDSLKSNAPCYKILRRLGRFERDIRKGYLQSGSHTLHR